MSVGKLDSKIPEKTDPKDKENAVDGANIEFSGMLQSLLDSLQPIVKPTNLKEYAKEQVQVQVPASISSVSAVPGLPKASKTGVVGMSLVPHDGLNDSKTTHRVAEITDT